ncbi:bifunctional ADP-dependent NAD(P)H-hydrate dehydratase/NAD(P)H-hydrate epimerase [Sphingobacterium deserti]|uniref:Bifunctional NAD(P)H-hydrate repair enzyme n=1 Tax=Sphingobacterium deserti TaxID=1229276 RepID=A0A0B8SZY9_9SPHI|nr:bifunctional ADP-dependent NAD(P)H-hydrate dehydratase/NAD(P)H-hydrate epimerase [Sphingobacterium deserti]KGE13341.1 carbohydrate kinase, YjeF related protein [Sphingobacterium deserti]
MKILSAQDIRSLEQQTEIKQQLSEAALMERAGRLLFGELQNVFGECRCKAEILCGFGNNGGDGLVLGRLLHEAGHEVTIYLVEHDHYSNDNLINQKRLRESGVEIVNINKDSILAFSEKSIILDALFGYGLSRLLDESWTPLIQQINSANNRIFAIDIPSGLLADEHTPPDAPVVKAERTYTLAFVKLALLLPAYGAFVGDFVLLDIGLDQDALHEIDTKNYYSTLDDVKKMAKPLGKFSHKGTFGHAVIAGGSYGSIGAVVLASRAALKTGCGLVSSYVPQCGYQIMQSTVPEALVKTDSADRVISNFAPELLQARSIAVGMGLGRAQQSQEALHQFLKDLDKLDHPPKLLLDADALNILSLHKEWLNLLPSFSILTPHPKELQRLIGEWENDFDKLQKASAWSAKYQQILVIKGANTVIIFPDGQLHFNSTGNPGMATAGAGDVLSGIIGSLLAQGYAPKDAAILGVFLHGLAGDCAAKTIHQKSITASDLIEHLSDAWRYLLS